MNLRIGKILQSASVIKIEMSYNDVPHILRIEAKGSDLCNGCFFISELNSVKKTEHS